MEDHKGLFGAIKKSLECLFVEMFNGAWKVFPFDIVNLIVTFFSFDLFTKEGRHLLDSAMVFKDLYSFSITEKVKYMVFERRRIGLYFEVSRGEFLFLKPRITFECF